RASSSSPKREPRERMVHMQPVALLTVGVESYHGMRSVGLAETGHEPTLFCFKKPSQAVERHHGGQLAAGGLARLGQRNASFADEVAGLHQLEHRSRRDCARETQSTRLDARNRANVGYAGDTARERTRAGQLARDRGGRNVEQLRVTFER